jgi:hypothetical protein
MRDEIVMAFTTSDLREETIGDQEENGSEETIGDREKNGLRGGND